MSDPKTGMSMKRVIDSKLGDEFTIVYNGNSVGNICPNVHVPGEWILTTDWNFGTYSAKSIGEAKKIAARELKASFKRHNLR